MTTCNTAVKKVYCDNFLTLKALLNGNHDETYTTPKIRFADFHKSENEFQKYFYKEVQCCCLSFQDRFCKDDLKSTQHNISSVPNLKDIQKNFWNILKTMVWDWFECHQQKSTFPSLSEHVAGEFKAICAPI